jgi:hypothetical protein
MFEKHCVMQLTGNVIEFSQLPELEPIRLLIKIVASEFLLIFTIVFRFDFTPAIRLVIC